MKDPHFLYKALGFGAAPRIFTFAMTLISFPLMIRGLGAKEYGVFVYLTSITALLELIAGFGVPAAVGKAIAEVRTSQPAALGLTLRRWSVFQLRVFLISLLPAALISSIVVFAEKEGSQLPPQLLILSVTAMYLSVFLTFCRAILASLLSFRRLALLDTLDSTLRSTGWITVGLFMPTALSLAGLSVLGAVAALSMALLLVRGAVRAETAHSRRPDEHACGEISTTAMFKQSAGFLFLALGTRASQALPVILATRILGFEATGMWGVMTKLVEILSLPFTIVGNAVMVRANEIKQKGHVALQHYWDMLCKLSVLALAVSSGYLLISNHAAQWLLPGSPEAVSVMSLAAAMVFARSVSDLFAPASDYVGGLRYRIIFLCSWSIVQLPIIWIGAKWGAIIGCTAAVVGSYSAMVVGYVLIAARVFFGERKYIPPRLVWWAVGVIGFCAIFGLAADYWLWRMCIFLATLLAIFAATRPLRVAFWPSRIMRFDFA